MSEPFNLVGGAAIVTIGSSRTTSDVDILVSRNVEVRDLVQGLENEGVIKIQGGQYHFVSINNASAKNLTLDILTRAVNIVTFDEFETQTELREGIRVLKTQHSLAMKLVCVYLRGDDDHGDKKETDCEDIEFLSNIMVLDRECFSEECAVHFQLHHYHLYYLKAMLEPATVERLIALGVRKMVLP
ncbi:MAG: hypothetical protein M1819_001946 [Sarea resinae]|nr:MAG: hypothetical protein M1819_001946 [Sarea resinae]